jgi:bla regulator protein BlaR1
MSAFIGPENFLNWLLNRSLQAGVLVLLVLLLQRLFRRQLTYRWRFALWWIVLGRLLLPLGPESVVSVFNYLQPGVQLHQPHTARVSMSRSSPVASKGIADEVDSPAADPNAPARASGFATAARSEAITVPTPIAVDNRVASSSPRSPWSWASALALLWLTGVVILSSGVLIQVARFQLRLKRTTTAVSPATAALLATCRSEFGVTRHLEVLESNLVRSPALFGLFRLRLLLPPGLASRFSSTELRYIFLHELAHVKRGDLWLNWLVTVLQILHWFNPLIWFGFARLRADRELACDELTLLRAGEEVGTSYGETVIKLLEGMSRPAAIPGLVGILEDKAQMRRRISMIASFRRPGRWSALAAILLAVVAVTALTDAQTQKTNDKVTDSTIGRNSETNSVPDLNRPDLSGVVHTRDGKPLVARVFISTAAPKSGTSTFCPSCYADCRKNVSTDPQGHFKIEALDPQLTFRILAVTKGYKPKLVEKVDPTNGPVQITLEPITAADATPDRSLRGRVVDVKGAPIEGAAVEMVGIETREGGGKWGSLPGIDPLAVTDGNGEFLITAKEPFN